MKDDARPDLTPMIDIIFNLIIFFMIVAELSSLSVEVLALPAADQARRKELVGKRLCVNVLADGRLKVDGKTHSREALAELLTLEAAAYAREPDGTSKLELNVRADGDSRYEHLSGVLDGCVQAEITRTHIAANEEVER